MNENGNPGFDMIEMSLDRPKEEPSTETESLEAVQEIAAETDDGAAATEIAEEEAAEPAPAEEVPAAEPEETEEAEETAAAEEPQTQTPDADPEAAEAAEAEVSEAEAAEEGAVPVFFDSEDTQAQEEEPVKETENKSAEEQKEKTAEKKEKPVKKVQKPAVKKPASKASGTKNGQKSDPAGKKPGSKKQQQEAREESERWRMPGLLKFLVWLAFTLAAGLILAYFAWMCAGDVFALSKPDREVEITITQQDTLDDVIEVLVEEGLVEYEWLFRLYCSLANAEERISVGTFTLNNIYDYNALLKGMQAYSGTRETTEVTIPEGYTCKQIFAALEEANVCTVEELETAAASYMFDYEFLQALPYGAANRLEGYLFPDTYEFYINDTPERVLSKFLDNFGWKFEEDLRADIAELNEIVAAQMRENGFTEEKISENMLDMHDVIIVASLIERETGGASESSQIASVIYNRLSSDRYPLLEIDASVRYGLDKWAGTLTAEDLAKDTPYNTRRNPGLPAGPISNPGLDSIRAALYPRNTEYYFYVLTPDGFHHFSETYYEHQDYIEEMQRIGN